MSDEKLDAILRMQIELSGQMHGLTIAVAHLFSIEARENPGGAADRALSDVTGTVEGVERQLHEGPVELRVAITEQLQRCLELAAAQIERAKNRAPTSSARN